MFRSLSRVTVATALVFAFLLSTVPVQAQPRGADDGLTLDVSWFEATLGWLESFLGGEGSNEVEIMSGPCLDPFGGCIDG